MTDTNVKLESNKVDNIILGDTISKNVKLVDFQINKPVNIEAKQPVQITNTNNNSNMTNKPTNTINNQQTNNQTNQQSNQQTNQSKNMTQNNVAPPVITDNIEIATALDYYSILGFQLSKTTIYIFIGFVLIVVIYILYSKFFSGEKPKKKKKDETDE